MAAGSKTDTKQDRSSRRQKAQRERAQIAAALLLAWVAGIVDAVGYLILFKLFTAHMSGNSVEMGLRIGQGQWAEALRRGLPVPLFIVGVAAGAFLIEASARRGIRYTFSLTLVLEAALLIAFMVYGSFLLRHGNIIPRTDWQYYVLMALPILAMGLQTSTLQRIGGSTVRTTYVTGMLTNLAQAGVSYLFWLRDHTRGRSWRRFRQVLSVSPREPSFRRMALLGSIWISYAVGAILGGYAELRWALWSVGFALATLALVLVVDLIQPIHPPSSEE